MRHAPWRQADNVMYGGSCSCLAIRTSVLID